MFIWPYKSKEEQIVGGRMSLDGGFQDPGVAWPWSGCEKSAARLGYRDALISRMFTRWFNQLKNRILRSILKQRQYLTY